VRQNAWITLLKARAIENQCFVAGSNRTGTDGEGIVYSGESMIINSRGGLIASAETEKEGSISAEISITELSDFRKRFPVMNDADDFTIAL
jgi:predicted amidohydrolase